MPFPAPALALLAVLASSPAAVPVRAPCAACIAVSITPGQALALPPDLKDLEVFVRVPSGEIGTAASAVREIADRHGRAGLHIEGVPSQAVPASLGSVTSLLVDLTATDRPDPIQLAFTLKTRITEARAAGPTGMHVGVAASAAVATALLARDLGPYLDFIVWSGEAPADTGTPAVWRAASAPVPVLADLARVLRQTSGGDARWFWRAPADVVEARTLLDDLARGGAWLRAGLFESPGSEVRCGEAPAQAFMDPDTLDTIAVAYDCPAASAVVVRPQPAGAERVVLAGTVTIVRVPAAADQGRFAESVQVGAARRLSVEEIVARHQAAAARQAAIVRTLVSTGTLTLTFEAPGFPAPITISSEAILYVGQDRSEIEQRSVRVNGVAFRGGGVPKLPIIEPERVASPPLTITLTDVYRYRLAGTETVDGIACYVVAFEPVDAKRPLFRGRAWIAAEGFAMTKVAAVQTGLRGAVVSSEQVDEYRRVREEIWLLARSDVRQMYEGAAHRTPIHRVLAIDRQEVNPPDFESRRRTAYASNSIMLRDTPQGFRYLRRDEGRSSSAPGAIAVVPGIAGRADRVRTLALGVIVDPNITRPLPFAGISYVDFNLFGTGTQFNGFFGGTYGQLAFSVPSVAGTRWQLAGRAFGIASSYNDRAFVGGRERYDEDIRQRPAAASVWMLKPLTPRISVRVGYDLDYTHFAAGTETAPAFRVPANQVVHGARVALEGQRGGWNASVWLNPARRSGWRGWGRPGSGYDPEQQDFLRYGASLGRSAVMSPRLVARIEAAWMAGTDLDRFSRYSFGTFDNRLRGYPSALVRYDRGGVVRGALGWATGRLVRIDAFLDTAAVHDPGFGRGVRNYTGVGAAAEVPAPFGTLVAVEWGYGFQGVNSNGTRGTQVIRISGYKVF
jgi:hypothetical protein